MKASVPILCLAVVMCLTACGSNVQSNTGTPAHTRSGGSSASNAHPAVAQVAPVAKKLTPITLRLPFLAQGSDAPYVLAEAGGYFTASGLKLSVLPGNGAPTTIERVASGGDQFGVADATVVAKLISQGVPVRVLAAFQQINPNGFIHNPNVVIRTPQDIVGRTLVTNPASAPAQLLPDILGRYKVKMSQLKFLKVSSRLQVQTFLKKPDSVLLGASSGTYGKVLKFDPKAQVTLFSQFGLDAYSSALITNTAEMKNHPQVVRSVVQGTIRGWNAALRDPSKAVDATKAAFPNTDPTVLAVQLKYALELLHTPATRGHPTGWMAPSDWRSLLDIIHRYGGVKHLKPPSDYYTDQYIGSGSS